MKKPSSIAIYSRKSKFTGKGESIDNQIELCKQYIRTHYPDVGDEDILVYEDEGFSGGNTQRPQFKKMIADAMAKQFAVLVCYRLDRISRHIGDFAKLIEELDGLGVSFVSIKEQFDTSSPMGRAMMYISSVFSQLERETIAERIRDNMHELSKTGRWLGGTTPTGYASESIQNVTIDGKVKKACKLQLIPEEGEIVQTIFKMFLENNSMSKTETWLIQNGYKTKNGRLFTRFAIRNILTNPVYMMADEAAYKYLTDNGVDLFAEKADFDGASGMMVYNRTVQKAGKAHVFRPMEEWIVAVGKHTGLISGEQWVLTQKRLGQNTNKSYRKPRSNVALLSGLLRCTCGDYMRPKMSQRKNAEGELIYSYLCGMKEKSRSHSCNMKNPNGNMLDKAICEEIKKLGSEGSDFMSQIEKGQRQLEGNRTEYGDTLEALKAEFAENEKEIGNLVGTLAKVTGGTAENYILKQIDEMHEKGSALKNRIAELEGLMETHTLSDIEFDVVRDVLANFRLTLDQMGVERKREAIRAFVKRIVWDGKNVHVYIFGSNSDSGIDLPVAEDSMSCDLDEKSPSGGYSK